MSKVDAKIVSGWLRWVSLTVLVSFCLALAGFKTLEANSLLPPPPLVGTPCIDVKLEFLRQTDLNDVSLIGVGSSATWRNLLMEPFIEDGRASLNAAPCHLHIHETRYYTELLLELIPQIDTVILITAPRDFDACPPQTEEFMNTWLAKAYLRQRVPKWLPYLANPRLGYLLAQAQRRVDGDPSAEEAQSLGVLDRYGTSVMKQPVDYRPPLVIDDTCFGDLRALSSDLDERDIRLIVVTLPVMPEWAATYDPDGSKIARWADRIESELADSAMFLEYHLLDWDDSEFADPVHLLRPGAAQFSAMIAESLPGSGDE